MLIWVWLWIIVRDMDCFLILCCLQGGGLVGGWCQFVFEFCYFGFQGFQLCVSVGEDQYLVVEFFVVDQVEFVEGVLYQGVEL